MAGLLDGIASTADHLAGSTDEAIGRQFDDTPGGGVADGVVSTYDGFASGVERASKRQFDDEPGGGALDLDTYVPGMESPGSDAEVPETEGMATQPLSERSGGFVTGTLGAIPRQFDDEAGGGLADGFWESVGAAGDWAMGDVDETIGRATSWPMMIAIAAVAFLVAREVSASGGSA
ncbi:hypothetical protein [Halosimplex halobium]|uniref:hypothetical protein n=1 Tax=Halosimplex halobium TaxID=3396618 RepID=UPI003F55BB2B